jgi:pimeloyl-ACP methyl ester carboxylesterase
MLKACHTLNSAHVKRKEKRKMRKNKSIAQSTLLIALLATMTIATFQITFAAGAEAPYTEINGVLNGANYTIRFPKPIENWNGMLVMLCRGYSPSANIMTGAPVTVMEPPIQTTGGFSSIAPLLTAEGYAIAASNYGAVGMSIQKGINSTYDLTQYVITNFNVTGKVFIIGQSMGGDIALLLGQKYPNIYSGVIDESGVKNLTDIYNGSTMQVAMNDSSLVAYLQSQNLAVIPYPLSMFATGLPLNVQLQIWRGFVRQAATDIASETGGIPTAVPQTYAMDSPVMNANISIPVITIHGTKDGLVLYSQSADYQSAVVAAGKSYLYRLYRVEGAEHVDSQIVAQTIQRLTELVDWSNTMTYYRGWNIQLYQNRIYTYSPQGLRNVPFVQSIGTWDAEFYGKLGWTLLDLAKPSIDQFMNNPYVR